MYIYICKYVYRLMLTYVDLWFVVCPDLQTVETAGDAPRPWENSRRNSTRIPMEHSEMANRWIPCDPCDSWDGLKGQRCTAHLGGTLGEKVKNRKKWFVNTSMVHRFVVTEISPVFHPTCTVRLTSFLACVTTPGSVRTWSAKTLSTRDLASNDRWG